MDFRSIKNTRTKTIRRALGRPGAGTIGVFTGSIDPNFNRWVGSRWGILQTGLFRAVPLNFRQPTNAFGQMSWPQFRETKSSFSFAPNIQLTFNPYHVSSVSNLTSNAPLPISNTPHLTSNASYRISNAFFESHASNFPASPGSKAAQVFSTNNYLKFPGARNSLNYQSSPRSTVALSIDARQFWPTAVHVKDRRPHFDVRPATTALRTSEKFFRDFNEIVQTHLVTRHSESTERPLLINLSSAFQHWTQTLRSNLIHRSPAQGHTGNGNNVLNGKFLRNVSRDVNAATFPDGRDFVNKLVHGQNTEHVRSNFAETILSLGRWLKTKPIDEATSSRQSFMVHFTNSRVRPRQALKEQSFASVVQKFAAPKSSSAETLTRQIQYFGPQPDLRYARSESPQLQQLVAALREVRPANNESKAPVPQLPSIAQLTSQVRQELEREIRIERERRGL